MESHGVCARVRVWVCTGVCVCLRVRAHACDRVCVCACVCGCGCGVGHVGERAHMGDEQACGRPHKLREHLSSE